MNELSDDELLAMTEAQGQINPAQELEVEESHLNGIVDAEFDEDEV